MIVNLLIYLSVFLFSVYPYSDYDWGWHYRYGEYFFQHGALLKQDIFSWTLPGYQWINHSWAYDPLMYVIFRLGGFTLVMLVGALAAFLVYYISVRIFKLSFWQKVLMALFYIQLSWIIMSQSLRSQILIWPLYPILMLILIASKKNPKRLFFLPPLFLIWANFHGTFTIGLLVIGLFLGTQFLIDFKEEKKNLWLYFGVSLATFAATLINPYGHEPYMEAIRHFASPWLTNVFEWMPLYVFLKNIATNKQVVGYYFIAYAVALGLLFIKRRRWTDLPYAAVISVLMYQTINHNRYIGPLIGVSMPVLALFLKDIRIPWERYKTFNLFFIIIIAISLELGWQQAIGEFKLFTYNFEDYCRYSTRCSEKMAKYLYDNPPKGNGLNFYDAGGYLIGRGVPVKLFIDGRMHLWEKDGYMPFADYIKIYYQHDYETFKKYNFDWILLRNDSPMVEDLATPSIHYGAWDKAYVDGDMILYVKK